MNSATVEPTGGSHTLNIAEIDLFSFDDPSPAPAPAAPANDDFGAFQATPAPVVDDEFGSFVASKTASQPDPFAAPPPVQPAVAAASFDAFGNMGGAAPVSSVPFVQTTAPMMQSNGFVGGTMNSMNMAFGNMSMGQTQQAAPSQVGGDDDFGDFAAAPKSFSMGAPSIRADPLSKLVSLDGLSKNPNNNKQRE